MKKVKNKLTTHDKRKKMLDDLNGEFNGWLIYQYYSDILGGANQQKHR